MAHYAGAVSEADHTMQLKLSNVDLVTHDETNAKQETIDQERERITLLNQAQYHKVSHVIVDLDGLLLGELKDSKL